MNKLIGTIFLPGDKSISHRAALFSALRPQPTEFKNYNFNQDCSATLECLKQLGVNWHYADQKLKIEGRALTEWRQPPSVLDAKNSGTTARLLSAILANLPFETTLDGDLSLRKRPMQRVIKPLEQSGAVIKSEKGNLPLTFSPVKTTTAIRYRLPMASAQVKSAVLLNGLFASGQTEVIETLHSRDHTERMLKLRTKQNADGSRSIFSDAGISIPDLSMTIPGDFSSAAFFIAGALLLPGSEIVIKNVSLNPTRTGFLKILQQMGAQIKVEQEHEFPEPAGTITVGYSELRNIEIPPQLVANIIDEIPILAVLACTAQGTLKLRNAGELRFKESDRIALIVENMRNLGIEIEEYDDGFEMPGLQRFKGGSIRTAGDHRIAMSFAIADLVCAEDIQIDNPDCVAVSFPEFWNTLNAIR